MRYRFSNSHGGRVGGADVAGVAAGLPALTVNCLELWRFGVPPRRVMTESRLYKPRQRIPTTRKWMAQVPPPPPPVRALPKEAYTPLLTRVLAFIIDWLPVWIAIGIGVGITFAEGGAE